MNENEFEPLTIDTREIQPIDRHSRIFEEFMTLQPGQELHVIVDHDPRHLLEHMTHEGIPVEVSSYRSYHNDDGTFVGVFRRDGNKVSGKSMKITSFGSNRDFSDDRFNSVSIYNGDSYKVILTYIRKGQFIPVHAPATDLVFVVFSGTGTATAGEKEVKIFPGSIVIVPGGEKRGIKAETDMEALHLASPIPGEQDHAEVVEKLARHAYL